jgi:hypothetical protein
MGREFHSPYGEDKISGKKISSFVKLLETVTKPRKAEILG